MTVQQLRVLLAQLPAECEHWPVAVGLAGDEHAAVGIILLPAIYADHQFPDGCVVVSSWVADKPPARDIRIYRPPAGPAAG